MGTLDSAAAMYTSSCLLHPMTYWPPQVKKTRGPVTILARKTEKPNWDCKLGRFVFDSLDLPSMHVLALLSQDLICLAGELVSTWVDDVLTWELVGVAGPSSIGYKKRKSLVKEGLMELV